MRTYIQAGVQAGIHKYMHTCTHTYMQVHAHTGTCAYIQPGIHTHIHTCAPRGDGGGDVARDVPTIMPARQGGAEHIATQQWPLRFDT